MAGLRFFVLILFLSVLIFPCQSAKAEEILTGGVGGNLVVREGQLTTLSEDLTVRLHLGFAEVEQNYVFQNQQEAQQIAFGFPYHLGGHQDQSIANIHVLVDGQPIDLESNKEANGQDFLYWKLFSVNFATNQTRTIQVQHWQLNGANLRGARTFNYTLKDKTAGRIGQFSLKMFLMDGLSIAHFNKTLNPDFDLKLEPLGWTQNDSLLSWQWRDFQPGFNLAANFYWAEGDLAKTSQLNQNFGLYQVTATSNNEQATQAADSSYLSAWQEKANGAGVGESLNFDFGQTRNIQEIGLIPGLATSLENFQSYSRPKEIKLDFSDGTTQTLTLEDRLAMQYLTLTNPVQASSVRLTIGSVYPGSILPDETFISEVEFGGNNTSQLAQAVNETSVSRPAWQQFFVNLWVKISNWFKNIF